MNMNIFWVVVALLIPLPAAIPAPVLAQLSDDRSEQRNPNLHRFEYGHNPKTELHRFQYPTDGPVPDGVALRHAAARAAQNPEMASALFASLTGREQLDTVALVDYLGGLYQELEAERQELTARVTCHRPTVSGDEAYRLLDSLDDLRYEVDEKYYKLAMAELGNDQAEDLQLLLDAMKRGISANLMDHKKAYEGASPNKVTNDILYICESNRSD